MAHSPSDNEFTLHFERAKTLLAKASDGGEHDRDHLLAEAQVHATLAQAAATWRDRGS
jgi:hypothetical protein